VLTRESQLPLAGVKASGGIWAPTIRHHAGRFCMVTTNMTHGGNFLVTAERPDGPWSDPAWIDKDWFDPSLFFDDDGTTYYTRRSDEGVAQAVIDPSTGKLEAPVRHLSRGLCSPDAEGPHLYKIDGVYYLMMAEGGTRFGHSETIARSRSPWGPWEPCPHNPIVTHRHLSGGFIRDTGHADLFRAPNGSWWLACLGTRHTTYDSASILGRETFLAPVSWKDGWPVVGDKGTIPKELALPAVPSLGLCRDNFDAPSLGPVWAFVGNPRPEDWSLRARPGWLRLEGSPETPLVGRRQQHFECRAAVLVDVTPEAEHDEAGLVVHMEAKHHYDLVVTKRGRGRSVVLRRSIGDLTATVSETPIGDGHVVLEVLCNRDRIYTLRAGPPGAPLATIGTADGRYISPENAWTWTGMFLAMHATTRADFDWFEYEGNDEKL
jgi:alpha-N-arabinofuranosidase